MLELGALNIAFNIDRNRVKNPSVRSCDQSCRRVSVVRSAL